MLPLRVRGFKHEWLDQLCLSGDVAWGRLWSVPASGKPSLSQVPLCLLPRVNLDQWLALAPPVDSESLSGNAKAVLAALNIADELFTARRRAAALESSVRPRAERALAAVEQALKEAV